MWYCMKVVVFSSVHFVVMFAVVVVLRVRNCCAVYGGVCWCSSL